MGISLVLVIAVGYLWLGTFSISPSKVLTQQRCFHKNCFHLEIAKTPAQRELGLMFREKLDKNYGMVFVFSDSTKHSFWMKNTLIPLDMIRLDSSYKIVDIQQASPCLHNPCQIYVPKNDANYVIELNQGTAKNLGMKPDDRFIPSQ